MINEMMIILNTIIHLFNLNQFNSSFYGVFLCVYERCLVIELRDISSFFFTFFMRQETQGYKKTYPCKIHQEYKNTSGIQENTIKYKEDTGIQKDTGTP
jgi:hypothetical protein